MKRCKNKRKLAVLGLAAAMALSLAACGEKRPSQEDVEQSIEAGTLTIEDALDKGWVDQAWVDAYYEENSVPAASKTASDTTFSDAISSIPLLSRSYSRMTASAISGSYKPSSRI